jgi:hypothetical protein
MIITLSAIRQADGSKRNIFATGKFAGKAEGALRPGEEILYTLQASTFASKVLSGDPEALKALMPGYVATYDSSSSIDMRQCIAELLEIEEICERGDFVDIDEKLL